MTQLTDTVLMVRPAAFGYNAETAANNFFQYTSPLGAEEIHQKALEEFDAMVALLRSKDIEVLVVDDTPRPYKPDAVFPNNWISTGAGGVINVFPMFAASRREEKRDDILQGLARSYEVAHFYDWTEYEAENMFLEGTGSMVMDHTARIVYACLSPRTNGVLLEKFASVNGYRAIAFKAVDEQGRPIYHTNVMMSIGEGFAVLCTEAIRDELEQVAVHQLLERTGHRVIPISLGQVRSFAGNMLQVKSKGGARYLVLSRTASNILSLYQKEELSRYGELLPVELATIEQASGGSARCMMAEIFLHPKAQSSHFTEH